MFQSFVIIKSLSMSKKILLLLALIITQVSLIARPGVPPPGINSPGSSKLLSDWIGLHLTMVRNTKGITQGQVFRNFMLSSISLYESIVAGDKTYRSLAGQMQEFTGLPAAPPTKNFCWEASASAALASILKTFYTDPAQQARVDSMENAKTSAFVSQGYSRKQVDDAYAYGKSVAEAVVAWSKTDGSAVAHPPYQPPKGEGLWDPTPPGFAGALAPYAYKNRTCVKGSTDNTLPPPPAAFSSDPSSPFYKMVKEVYDYSQNATPEEKSIALFWDDLPDGRYFGAGGHWASIFRQVSHDKNLSLMQAAEAFAKMNIAVGDAFNACWKAKYHYNLLRPVTYIQKYMNQPDWKPLIITPTHPEYPAAHATLSMAAAIALTNALGNNISFTDHSYDDLGYQARTYKNFEEAGKEAGISRLYGGIHYKPSIEAGYIVGSTAANNVLKALQFRNK